MIANDAFSFIYEDDEDAIHINRGLKREFHSDFAFPLLPTPTVSEPFNSILRERVPNFKKRKACSSLTENGDHSKSLKISKSNPTPDIVIKQICYPKSNVKEVLELFLGLECIASNSKTKYLLTTSNIDINNNQIPTLLFFFDCSDLSHLKFLEMFSEYNVKVIAITPDFKYYNAQSYPIVLDKHGKIAKLLSIRNPVGGGIYAIPSIFLFDRFQSEIIRIKLGYDYNVFYDSSLENNLQKVLMDAVIYTLNK